MSEPIDPAIVMAKHAPAPLYCFVCCDLDGHAVEGPCLPYRLAEALAAEQAKSARVAELAHRFEIVPRARLLGALTAKAKS